jgi:hypothetical protein
MKTDVGKSAKDRDFGGRSKAALFCYLNSQNRGLTGLSAFSNMIAMWLNKITSPDKEQCVARQI